MQWDLCDFDLEARCGQIDRNFQETSKHKQLAGIKMKLSNITLQTVWMFSCNSQFTLTQCFIERVPFD